MFYTYLEKIFNISLKTTETQTVPNSPKNPIDNYNRNTTLKTTVTSINNISTESALF